MQNTPTYGFPYPEQSDPPDGATQIQNLAEAVEGALGQTATEIADVAGTVPIALAAHEAEADPHTQYVAKAGGTMTGPLVLPAGIPADDQAARTDWVKQWDEDHVAAADPHPQYLKPAEIVAGANITVTENAGVVTIAGQAGGGGGASTLDALTDVVAPANTPAGKVLGTTAEGVWGPIDDSVTVAYAAPTEPPARDGLLWVVVPAPVRIQGRTSPPPLPAQGTPEPTPMIEPEPVPQSTPHLEPDPYPVPPEPVEEELPDWTDSSAVLEWVAGDWRRAIMARAMVHAQQPMDADLLAQLEAIIEEAP
jgi:hypothetical protein